MWSLAFFHILLGCIPKLIILAHAIHNVTVNNTDPNIVYSAHDWTFSTYNSGATDHWSSFEGAMAVYNFTGVAIYYSVHLYSNHDIAGVNLSLDGRAGDDVQLFDPNSTQHGETPVIVWSKTNLENINHSLTAQIPRDVGLISLDTLIVTVLDSGDPGSAATGTSAVTSSNIPTNPSDRLSVPSKKRTIGIAVGTVLGFVVVGALVGCLFIYRKRQMQPSTTAQSTNNTAPSNGARLVPVPRFIGHKFDAFSNQSTIGYKFLPEVHSASTASLPSIVQANIKPDDNRFKQLPELPNNVYSPQTFTEAYPAGISWTELGPFSGTSFVGTQDGESGTGRYSIRTISTPPPNYVSGLDSIARKGFK
ncbi:hypothetical protein VKT23_011776 [Stygiomarasmius scandens]|uniref:Mid2 domain-containing protein n=1 Tax=Marasmiellus scandens TaxID=2682957 RepID=A0ABR1JC12_9AGAR